MKLKPTTFYATFKDGLVLLAGHEFEVHGRKLVVHKTRPILLPIDKDYKVSELVAGFAIEIEPTRNRMIACRRAADVVIAIPQGPWEATIKSALMRRRSLPVLEA
jgi:hypothetical protein